MATQRRIHGDIQAVIEGKALERWTPAQIEKWLNDDDRFKGKVPTLRTIQRIVRDILPLETSGEWRLLDSEPSDVALVVETLGAAIVQSGGRVTSFSRDLADLIVRIRRAAPDLGLHAVYLLASHYSLALQRGWQTAGIDALLALAPWKGPEAEEQFQHALAVGWIPGTVGQLWKTVWFEVLLQEAMSVSETDIDRMQFDDEESEDQHG